MSLVTHGSTSVCVEEYYQFQNQFMNIKTKSDHTQKFYKGGPWLSDSPGTGGEF